ncbi:MAG: efflux RND transporter periplasmic adaptor subunit [Myxococcota bacterium]|nr:efflux RND transporter periplasmic adaptor subunit [Myxococcota bacterium]MDW8361034.1 efflux RND transporter periplasmic adaptor subunit [Myxococcales bacterium]
MAASVAMLVVVAVGAALAVRLAQATARRAAQEQSRAEAEHSSLEAVDVVNPSPIRWTPTVVVTGTLEPVRAAELAFETGGRIRSVEVALGDRVEAGAIVAVLDRASIGAAGEQSAAAVAMAEAQLAMARDRLSRLEALARSGAAAEAERTAAQQAVALAEAQLAQARASQRATRTAGAHHVLRAPFAGTMTRVPEAPGLVVGPGVPVARIEDLSAFRLRTSVSEREVALVRAGQLVEVGEGAVGGRLRVVVPSLDPTSRRAPVEIDVPNPDGRLVGRSLVEARIRLGEPVDALALPGSALRADGTVLLVDDDGTLRAAGVEHREAEDGSIVVLDGLQPTARVVLQPSARLAPGMRVRAHSVPPRSERPTERAPQ